MIPGGVPTSERKLLSKVSDWKESCRVSAGARSQYYRLLNALSETGRYDGQKALINVLNKQLERVAANLFSPTSLKFDVDFSNPYPINVYDRGREAARLVTREWDASNTDILFGRGVFEALKYGACILKQWPLYEVQENESINKLKTGIKAYTPHYQRKLVMPWNFGVYREDENELDKQEILCETSLLTMSDVWDRVCRFPDAEKIYRRAQGASKRGGTNEGPAPTNFFHQVLSTSQIQTGVSSSTLPGGLVQISNDPNYAILGPTVDVPMVTMHELWVKDEGDEYTTVQFIDPDIILTPHTMRVGDDSIVAKKDNLFITGSKMHPYTLIQPNEVTNWFWGRSELVDLIEPEMLLAQWCDDARRLFGLQVDKILAFSGMPGLADEVYDQFRVAGYIGMPQGSSVNDLTPKIPAEMLPMIQFLLETMNWLGNFPPVMEGRGEQGVRAQGHADTLVKTASPTLRDRSLIVERQCAKGGDKTLTMMEAKDERFYYTKADKPTDIEETKFLLSALPEDWRIVVDSHSSSPIFLDDQTQLVFAAFKAGIVDAEYVIDNVPLPAKEIAKVRHREREQKQAAMMENLMKQNPELGQKIVEKQAIGGKHR